MSFFQIKTVKNAISTDFIFYERLKLRADC